MAKNIVRAVKLSTFTCTSMQAIAGFLSWRGRVPYTKYKQRFITSNKILLLDECNNGVQKPKHLGTKILEVTKLPKQFVATQFDKTL